MNRWLLAGLLGLAILVFLMPGIVGMLAERSLDKQLDKNSQLGGTYAVRELDFRRGWFTSAGRHRVPVADQDVARIIATLTPGAGLPAASALIIDTRLEHGLVPLGSAPRSASALIPALATGVSTFSLELPTGNVLPVPGVLYSRIGLTGSATFRFELPAGDETRDGVRLVWQAGDLGLSSNNNGRELSISADLAGLLFNDGVQRLELAQLQMAGNSRATSWGFAIGDVDLELKEAAWLTGDTQNRIKGLDLSATSAIEGSALQGALQLNMLGLDTDDGRYDLEIIANAAGVDAATLGPILRALRYSGSDPRRGAEPYPGFDGDLRRLMSAGVAITIDSLQLRTFEGDGVASLSVTVPKLDETASWPGLLLALEASANIEIDSTRVEAPSPLSEQFRVLVAGGFLVPDGEVYRLQADYAKGKATVNGAPLVIPMDMLR
ncbi:MAG: DUF945 family protein [Woeseia sp.]|nr:YdgA family protein [Woeseia sp.]MBT8097411.1 YdgA family protein [Woeseia sp.]NNE60142.1 DUF945 family protein [Woeseia sp.]NNL53848.1 DUF945 family protein [Woeseia sp.]